MNDAFAKLKLALHDYLSPDVITKLEVYFDLRGSFKNSIELFNALELKKLWGVDNTIFFKLACQDMGWQKMVDLIENYERKVPIILAPTSPVQNIPAGHKVFISFCNDQKDEVEKIKKELVRNQISVEYEPVYMGDIPTFMKKVRTTNFVLLMISKEYLENEFCMTAVMELKKDDNYKDRMLLIVHDNAKISTSEETVPYIQFWQNKHAILTARIASIPLEAAGTIGSELKKLRNITNEIAEFIAGDIRSKYIVPLKDLQRDNYAQIIQYILTH